MLISFFENSTIKLQTWAQERFTMWTPALNFCRLLGETRSSSVRQGTVKAMHDPKRMCVDFQKSGPLLEYSMP